MLCASAAFGADAHRPVVTRVNPVYPELARRMHVVGTVVLRVTIQADGKVTDAKVESGHALLGPSAEEAVRQWHFAPGPDTTQTTIDINFTDGK
jgi:TonB family protein